MKTNSKSNSGFSAKSAKGASIKRPHGVRLYPTKIMYGIVVPASTKDNAHPYMFMSMRVRDPLSGVHTTHAGVVINRFIYNHYKNMLTAEGKPFTMKAAVESFADMATYAGSGYGVTVTPSDIRSYMRGTCQPKCDKRQAICDAIKLVDKNFSERELTGWTNIGYGRNFQDWQNFSKAA